jgi:hypothetical protein
MYRVERRRLRARGAMTMIRHAIALVVLVAAASVAHAERSDQPARRLQERPPATR